MKAVLKTTVIVALLAMNIHASAQNKPRADSLWKPWYISPRSGAQHVDLSGTWQLSHADKPVDKLSDVSKTKESFQTEIPNSVHWSLYKAGKLPHPYYNKNSDLYKWTDEKVWYYTKTFDLPSSVTGSNVFLCFDGVDYFSKVWVNDSLVGEHEGMFGGPNVEVSRWLKPGAANRIAVELRAGNWGQKADDYESLPRLETGSRDFSKRKGYNSRASGKIIKPWVISGGNGGEMFFSLGMWRGVRLEVVPKTHLERPYLTTKSISGNKALLHLSTEVFANAHSLQQTLHPWNNTQLRHPDERGYAFKPVAEKASLVVEFFAGKEKAFAKEIPLQIFEGRNWVEEDIAILNPKLWNPTGLGGPNLYNVHVSLKKNGKIIDRTTFDYGIRTIERIRSAGPRTTDNFENWQFVANGKAIFVKGMNFTPQDVLLETSESRYRWTLTAAKKMGVQLIRVWGGGLLETDTFYRLCDSLGLMVWQDFPIGNQDTPGYPQDVWESQVVQNIQRLRNHPSLVVWCGGNEFNPYSYGNAASIGILERSLRTFDPSRLFVRTTPDGGAIHIYPDMDPTWYSRSYGHEAWISETGMHSIPEAGVFYEVVDTTEFVGLGKMWEQGFDKTHPQFVHHFTEYGPGRVPRMLSRASHIADMKDPSIQSVSEASQVGAGEFYQIVSEEVQGNYPVTTGLMPWVFKRHWPVIAIQMMDWFGHAGAPYYFLKRTYEPTHIAVDLPRLLWAPGEKLEWKGRVLSSPSSVSGNYRMSVTVYDDAFKQLYKTEKPLAIKSATAVAEVSSGSFVIPADYKDRFLFLVADLHDAAGKLVSRSYYQPRSLSRMEDAAFREKYIATPMAWLTFDNGPWLKPTVAKTPTTLSLKVIGERKISAEQSQLNVVVTNSGKAPAYMTKVDIAGTKRAIVASDNYCWLQPGETKEFLMDILWRETRDGASVNVHAWNAATISVALDKNPF